jgi:diketogulonate reductase-like aldo/keto reductase
MKLWAATLACAALMGGGVDARTVKLSNGRDIPLVGVGIGNLQSERIPAMVKEAVSQGVRIVDTARASRNEDVLGRLLAESQDGAEVMVLSKVWYTHLGFERTKLSVKESLKDLNREKVDIMLLHWPRCNDQIPWMRCADDEAGLPEYVKQAGPPPGPQSWKDSWKALEEMYKQGSLANIGISNFNTQEVQELVQFAEIKPHVFQGNLWAVVFDPALMRVLRESGIHFQAYNALNGVLPNLTPPHNSPEQQQRSQSAFGFLERVAAELSSADRAVTPAMLVLRWLTQQGISVIPRSASPQHLAENVASADLDLSAEHVRGVGQAVEALLRTGANLPPNTDTDTEHREL